MLCDTVADVDKAHAFLDGEKMDVVEELEVGFKGENGLEWIHGERRNV